MKMKTKNLKIIAVFLAVIMMIPVLPLSAFSASNGGFEYTVLDDGTAEIIRYTYYTDEQVDIPSEIDGYIVTSIAQAAFEYGDVAGVTIPYSVKSIGEAAFNCQGITGITVDGNNENYSNDEYGVLFNKDKTDLVQYPRGNSRTEYTIPDSVISIGKSAFRGVSCLVNITIPGSVTSIGDSAFFGCNSLTDIIIPDGVTKISDKLFASCSGLEIVTICGNITGIGESAFKDCRVLTDITIPDSVTNIGESAFKDCRVLTDITIPNSVTNIGKAAFKNCKKLTDIKIPDGITNISDEMFSGCTGLNNVTIPDGVTSIGNSAFYNCKNLTNISMPDSIISLGTCAFRDCTSLTGIAFYDGLISVGAAAFSGCTELISAKFPDSVAELGGSAFEFCTNLSDFTIPPDITGIYYSTFYHCSSLKNITIPENVTIIDESAFMGCYGLTSIIIPEKVATIGDYAFENCDGITNITIPAGVTSIGQVAFYGKNLADITVDSKNENYSNDEYGVLFNKDKTRLIQYPKGNIRTEYVIPDSVTNIGSCAFINCDDLSNITVPNGVVSVEKNAFRNCKGLTNILIPDSVISIDNYAFYNCENLESIYIFNPECRIFDYSNTIPYTTAIYGYAGSTAEAYADKYGNSFFVIEENECTDHIYGKWEITKNATCIDEGKKKRECTVCGFEDVETIPATDHELEHVKIPSTCKVAGAVYDVCLNCDKIFNSTDLPLAEHSFGEWETIKESTCIKKGQQQKICPVCGQVETRELDFADHTPETVRGKDATCTEKGLTSGSECSVCGVTLTEQKEIPTADHELNHVTNPSTCKVQGTAYDICENCSETFNYIILPLTDHSFGEWTTTVESTCVEQGKQMRTCSVCGITETRMLDYIEHNYVAVVTPPTCTNIGFTTHICSVCGDTFTDSETVMLPHSYGEWHITKEPTYLNEGERAAECAACGNVKTEAIEQIVASNEEVDEDTDIAVSFSDDTFEGEIELSVTKEFDGQSFNVLNNEKGNFRSAIYDITLTQDGEKIQPNGKVLVRMPIPEGYNPDTIVIYYVTNDGTLEKLNSYCKDGYVYFETTHFSSYAIVDESEEVPSYTLGDVNGDGKITAADARIALRVSAKLETLEGTKLLASDANKDGKITAADARMILRVSAKLDSFSK